MSWQDCGLYWAWRGAGPIDRLPPTVKRIEYADVYLRAPDETPWQRVACAVWDDDRRTEINQAEIATWASR